MSFTVYDDAGNVVASLCNYQNAGTDPTTAAEAAALYDLSTPAVNRVTTYAYDALGRRIQTTINAGVGANAANAQTTLTVYDALDRVIRTISNYVADVNLPNPYTAAHDAFAHGSDNTQNLVTDTAYNARGLVRAQTDGLGNVTLFGYDEADRLVKTVQSASQPTYNNDYTGTTPDPALANYNASSSADLDVVTTQAYDPAGNLVQTVDALGSVSYTVYDALNRPVKTVRSAKAAATVSLNEGDPGYDATNDPRSNTYAPSADPDRDLIATTDYDALGRVIRAQQLIENRPGEIWDTMLYGYDSLGRQVKVIRSASQPDYGIDTDPDLSGYIPTIQADQDITERTLYDVQGRVLATEDTFGVKTRIVYDGLNRQVKSVANFADQGEDPALWVWSDTNNRWQTSTGTAIDQGTQNDQNIIQATRYDSDGNVQETQDVLGRVIHYVYDSSNRLVRTITNYVAQGTSDPAAWLWNNPNSRWEDGSGSAISFGVDNDQNQIASTVYDTLGRVAQTIDARHNVTLMLYDGLGRRITTITNYVAQGASDPAAWLWNNNRWEDGSNNAISFGADNDQNRITATTYDLAGRTTATRDPAGVATQFAYDALGRRTQTIANYIDGVFNPSNPDEDLISSTSYNQGGQVVSTTDVRGTETAFTYDLTGRRLTVTQAAGSSLAATAYTCFDKAGRVLRTIANYTPLYDQNAQLISPDHKTGSAWDFAPAHQGAHADQNLITEFAYDQTSRPIAVTNPVGSGTQTAYFKDGQVLSNSDPLGVQTRYLYDRLRRRSRVIQNYVPVQIQERIAFSHDVTNSQIQLMNPDGTNVVTVTSQTGINYRPAWSPDGVKLVYQFNPSSSYNIQTIKTDGTGVQQLTSLSGSEVYPTWSPDGRWIAFAYTTDAIHYTPYIMQADGTHQRQLANISMLGAMQWSPDGQHLLFRSNTNVLQTMNADGTELTSLNVTGYNPTWSPDGSQIAYDTGTQIYVMNADGTNPVNLSAIAGNGTNPAWSADGTQIVYMVFSGGTNELYVMNADGTGATGSPITASMTPIPPGRRSRSTRHSGSGTRRPAAGNTAPIWWFLTAQLTIRT